MWYIHVITILWFICFLTMFLPHIDVCAQLPNWGLKLAVLFIFLIGSPIMLLGAGLTTLLGMVFPEGWNDDD